MVVPRFAGISTFMRLPHIDPKLAPGEIDIGILGIPFDGATTNRPGARLGPRQVREASSLMRLVNYGTLVAPYDLCACADLGDVPVNPIDVHDTLRRIEAMIAHLAQGGVTPLSVGGDHIISYPILRALGAKRPLGMIHVDAHSDTGDTYFGGQKLTHGTPFRRAIEDGVLDPKRTVQIGIRGTMYSTDERDWALDQGIRIIDMEEVAEKGIPYAIAEARRVVGTAPPISPSTSIQSIQPLLPAPARLKSAASRRARPFNWCADSATWTSSAPTSSRCRRLSISAGDGAGRRLRGVRAPLPSRRGSGPAQRQAATRDLRAVE